MDDDTPHPFSPAATEARGDEFSRLGQFQDAIVAYLEAASSPPKATLCLKIARCYEFLADFTAACQWALLVVDSGDDYTSWQRSWSLFQRCAPKANSKCARTVNLAILGSYTVGPFSQMLCLAANRLGIRVALYESQYGQYEQELINPQSGLYAFRPDVVVLAVHERDLHLPAHSDRPEEDVAKEITRWTRLWQLLAERCGARMIQHNFAQCADVSTGHLATRLPGSRYMMTYAVNEQLGKAAGDRVSIVDCERLSSLVGKAHWHDPRYWNLSKHAVALQYTPLLARHTAAVIAASLGLSRKCLVLDLDNTLWGGVIGEDGLGGIRLGNGVEGEAFVAFQEYILELKNKGVILAVCSKNNYADAIQPFEEHPDMRLRLKDIALFVANWDSKPDNLRYIAKTLRLGLDSLVFVDDNPVECAHVRQSVPEVDVIALPEDPSYYCRALSQYLLLETNSFTAEDVQRTDQYRAEVQTRELEASAASLDEFYAGLQMRAHVTAFQKDQLPRIVQLIGKTNQFNLTTRRYGMSQVERFIQDPHCLHLALRLRDRYADHGLVSLIIARRQGDLLDIDTWLMSCRVIGRTVEAALLGELSRKAQQLGCKTIRGTYIRTQKNAMAADAYLKLGFRRIQSEEGTELWVYDLEQLGTIKNQFIELVETWDLARGAA
jgi:FkbH-like protein